MQEKKKASAGQQCTNDKSRNEEEWKVSIQLLTILLTIGEIIWLQMRMFFEFCNAVWKKFCPAFEKSIENEIVLITGCGHGIGKELAMQLSSLGPAHIICVDIDKENNAKTADDIRRALAHTNRKTRVHAYECDVTSRERVAQLAESIRRQVGPVSFLFNNAGIMPTHSLLEHTEQEIRKTFDINVLAHFWLLQEFLPDMIEANHGHIVAMSSMAGLVGVRNLVPYCATKFAVRGLMEALHEEIRESMDDVHQVSNIRFTIVYPYMVDTGLCKRPRVKYPKLMGPMPAAVVAHKIVQAMRRNQMEVTIPSYMYQLNTVLRLLPYSVSVLIKDFLGSGLDSDL